MPESETESLTMLVKISKDEHPELFKKLSAIHNARKRGSVLRNLASLGLITTKVEIQSEQLVSSKSLISGSNPDIFTIKPKSGITDQVSSNQSKTIDIGICGFKLPDSYF